MLFRPTATRRGNLADRDIDNPNPANNRGIRGLDPSPIPWPIFQFLAFGFIILLGLLQFLPATHYRHPSDPHRNWIPLDSTLFSTAGHDSRGTRDGNLNFMRVNEDGDARMLHIVSWMDCLDLQVLSVLANSTLSNSRYPDKVFFYFFIPKGNEDKVSYYKLKVLFPHSNLEIHGQDEVKQIIRSAVSGIDGTESIFKNIAPFIIPSVHKFLTKFIYVSPDVIIKGKIEGLIGIDLSGYAIGAAEDCSRRLDMFVKSDILDAIQRYASKPWVSKRPYEKKICGPELNLLLIDATRLANDFLEAVIWWNQVLNLSERGGPNDLAIALALYNRYLKLPSSWMVRDSPVPSSSELVHNNMVIRYDGPKSICSEYGVDLAPHSDHAVWTRYLPVMSDRILGS